ncbi:hypothetical protein IWZ01DRAFT_80025 [Phyllosticta capitalensis]
MRGLFVLLMTGHPPSLTRSTTARHWLCRHWLEYVGDAASWVFSLQLRLHICCSCDEEDQFPVFGQRPTTASTCDQDQLGQHRFK